MMCQQIVDAYVYFNMVDKSLDVDVYCIHLKEV